MSFKIAIDAHAAEKEGTGNCTYVRNLLLELARIDRDSIYFVYGINISHPFYNRLKIYRNFKIKSLNFRSPFLRIPISLALRTYLDKIDLLHVQYIAPPIHRGKLVVTIHDLGHFVVPWTFPRFEVFRSKLLIPLSARRAQKILTGTKYAASEIRDKLNLPFSKIAVTPYGFSPELFKVRNAFLRANELSQNSDEYCQNSDKLSQNLREGLSQEIKNHSLGSGELIELQKKKYGFRTPYILSLSRLNPRKNFTVLVKAFEILKMKNNIVHQMIIVGREDTRSFEIKKIATQSPYSRDIIFTGYIPDEDLACIYGGADLFVFLSEYEGFGLPVVEAMACGTPVIAYASSCLPEVAGDAVMYIDELEPSRVAEKIEKLLENKALREKLKEKGKERIQRFSWKETARLTLEVYKEVLKNKSQK